MEHQVRCSEARKWRNLEANGCAGHMVFRQRRRDGHGFYGCSNYPHCQTTISNRIHSLLTPFDERSRGFAVILRDDGLVQDVFTNKIMPHPWLGRDTDESEVGRE